MTWQGRLISTCVIALFSPSAVWAQALEDEQRSAGVAIVTAEPTEVVEMEVLDPRGTLGQAELIERLQNVVWTERQTPTEGVPPAVASSMFVTMFQAVAGGGSGSQDLARLRDDWPE
ncbi:hypothetical protein [Algiphilus sp.]|uniref:hypothetical protein n=1 Tax=Algiphilus sp. TaxID=1872431 RepID=UPI003B525AA7